MVKVTVPRDLYSPLFFTKLTLLGSCIEYGFDFSAIFISKYSNTSVINFFYLIIPLTAIRDQIKKPCLTPWCYLTLSHVNKTGHQKM